MERVYNGFFNTLGEGRNLKPQVTGVNVSLKSKVLTERESDNFFNRMIDNIDSDDKFKINNILDKDLWDSWVKSKGNVFDSFFTPEVLAAGMNIWKTIYKSGDAGLYGSSNEVRWDFIRKHMFKGISQYDFLDN